MSAALYIPAIYLVTSISQGIIRGTLFLILIVVLQLVLAYPYMKEFRREYITSAFNMDRDFAPHVSFNWKFMNPDFLHSDLFRRGLLTLHLIFLVFFLFSRWLNFKKMIKNLGLWPVRILSPNAKISPYYIAEVFFI